MVLTIPIIMIFRTLVKFVDNFSWQMYNTIIDWSATFGKGQTNKGNKLNQPVCGNIILLNHHCNGVSSYIYTSG